MLITALSATLAVHLGLTTAIAEVVGKIASCEKCSAFWLTALVLYIACADLLVVVALSILAAYLSHWIGLFLITLQQIYSAIWERLNK
jgi:hypothetical protein